MIEQIKGYFVLTTCFFLLFILAFFLFERYKESICAFWAKNTWLSPKIPWNTISKIVCVWAIILFSRKLTYYLPISGVIQTKNTIWWVDEEIIFPLYGLFIVLLILLILLIRAIYRVFVLKSQIMSIPVQIHILLLMIVCIILFAIFQGVSQRMGISFGQLAIVFLAMPLLVLKMICSGKYLGLLTSLVLAYFSIYGYKNRKKILSIRRVLVVILLVAGFGVFGYYKFSGDWEKRFLPNVQAAKSQSAFEELSEAAQSITENNRKSDVLNHIAVAIKKTNDIQWAVSIAQLIDNTLTEIRERIKKKNKMIKQIKGWFILTACLFLLFFLGAALVEPYKERLLQLFKKISWKTARKFFYLWIGILVLRKLLYYIPFNGIMQTPASVWWVDKEVLITIYFIFIAFLFLFVGMDILLIDIKSRKRLEFFFHVAVICMFIWSFFFAISIILDKLSLIQFIISPLLVLKMLCSGRYAGLFVSFGLVYFIVSGYKKIRPGKNRRVTKFLLVIGLITIFIGIFIFSQFSGNWEKRFLDKAQTAKSELEIEDLVDAVKNIKDDIQRLKIFKEIAAAAAGTGNKKLTNHFLKRFTQAAIPSWKPDGAKWLYLNVILEAIIIVNQKDIKADKELCQQAIDVIQTRYARLKPGPLIDIAAAVAKTASKEWAKVICLQLIEAAKTITTDGWFKYKVLKGFVEAAASRKDMKGETAIFTAALNVAETISDRRHKSLALQAIAVAVTKTGDTQWAVSIAQRIPDAEIRDNTLTEMREKLEKK